MRTVGGEKKSRSVGGGLEISTVDPFVGRRVG